MKGRVLKGLVIKSVPKKISFLSSMKSASFNIIIKHAEKNGQAHLYSFGSRSRLFLSETFPIPFWAGADRYFSIAAFL